MSLADLRRKKNKLTPVLRIKRQELELASQHYAQLKIQAEYLKSDLQKQQTNYLKTVDRLNDARQGGVRTQMVHLESGAQLLKEKWVFCLREVKEVEQRIIEQLKIVLKAQNELKAYERLDEKYDEKIQEQLIQKSQLELDDFVASQYPK